MKNEDIEQYLEILIGKPLLDIGRASNMLWLGFGTPLETTDHNGKSYLKSSISLHVQSTWRISNKEEKLIKFASSDMYTPNSNIKWSEDFNWDVQGINLFDEKSREWLNNNQGLCVKDCRINCWGDLLLLFTNSDKLEIFVDVTDESECWRLFEQDSKKEHFVVTGQGVIF